MKTLLINTFKVFKSILRPWFAQIMRLKVNKMKNSRIIVAVIALPVLSIVMIALGIFVSPIIAAVEPNARLHF